MSGSRASVKQSGFQGRASSWKLVKEASWTTGWGLRQRPVLEPKLALEMARVMHRSSHGPDGLHLVCGIMEAANQASCKRSSPRAWTCRNCLGVH